jgi:hypothetical protein
MIEEAEQRSFFYRFVISPDPKGEDREKELFLREITEHTMSSLEDRLQKQIFWVAAEHTEHAPHRHIHVVAIVSERLQVNDFRALRQAATAACLQQRQERDLAQAHSQEHGKGEEWARSY